MTKEDLKQYRSLQKERERIQRKIERYERKAAAVPIIKDKVQSSQKEWPYIRTHVTVDAPEPKAHSALRRLIIMEKRKQIEVLEQLVMIEEFIGRITDSRTRQIIGMVYVDGKTMEEAGLEFDITGARVSEIIREAIEKNSDKFSQI